MSYICICIYIYMIYMLYICKIHTGLWPNTHHKCMNHSGAIVEHGGAILLQNQLLEKAIPAGISFLVGEVWSSSHGWITEKNPLNVFESDMMWHAFSWKIDILVYIFHYIYIYILYYIYIYLHPFFWKRETNNSWITKLPFTQLRPAGTVVPETLGVCEFGSSQSKKRRSTLWLFESLLWKPWPIDDFPS